MRNQDPPAIVYRLAAAFPAPPQPAEDRINATVRFSVSRPMAETLQRAFADLGITLTIDGDTHE